MRGALESLLHLTRIRGLLRYHGICDNNGNKNCTLPVLGDCYTITNQNGTSNLLHLTRVRGLLYFNLQHTFPSTLHLTYPETKQRFPKWKALHHFFHQIAKLLLGLGDSLLHGSDRGWKTLAEVVTF